LPTSGGVWTTPQLALHTPGMCDMNANLYRSQTTGRLFLTYHYGGARTGIETPGSCVTDNWSGAYIYSDNGGKSWYNTSSTNFPAGLLGSVKNKCVRLSNGRVLCPSSTESTVNDVIEFWQAHIEITDDKFSSFTSSAHIKFSVGPGTICPYYGLIQPTVIEHPSHNGSVVVLMRSGCGVIAYAWSHDYGSTWDAYAGATNLPNPNAGIDAVSMADSAIPDLGILVAYNPSSQQRAPLSLAYSSKFDPTAFIHLAEIETNITGSYAYPSVITDRFDPKVAHVCYSYSLGTQHGMRYARVQF